MEKTIYGWKKLTGRTLGPVKPSRITLTTICGTDLHILRGEYPVKPGLIIGHEPVGVIEELGEDVQGYQIVNTSSLARLHHVVYVAHVTV